MALQLDRNWSDLELQDVRERVYVKYEVSRSDAQLAVDYLACFFDAKRSYPEQLIILPQIADWAWHELILDTRRYRHLCSQIFGKFLHHRVEIGADAEDIKRLQATFERSLGLMAGRYGLGLGKNSEDWLDAGWNRPRYRLRNALSPPPFHKSRTNCALSVIPLLSWLPSRLERRFCFNQQMAYVAVREYSDLLCVGLVGHGDTMSTAAQVAWEEHVLWTARYEDDCMKLIGRFIHHDWRELIGSSLIQNSEAVA